MVTLSFIKNDKVLFTIDDKTFENLVEAAVRQVIFPNIRKVKYHFWNKKEKTKDKIIKSVDMKQFVKVLRHLLKLEAVKGV